MRRFNLVSYSFQFPTTSVYNTIAATIFVRHLHTARHTVLRSYSTSPNPPLIGRYSITPIELFRINGGASVSLRDYITQKAAGRSSYDLHLHDGLVLPKPGPLFEGPNGASLRSMGPMLKEDVRDFRGRDPKIHRLPKGVVLPETLVLLHEYSDIYSIQTTEPVKLKRLNKRITELLNRYAEKMTRKEFIKRYPF